MINSLYIHIPFCVRKCIYCDFLSVRYDDNIAGAYITSLTNEFNLRKELAGEIRTIYTGGGTPTTLSAHELTRLIQGLRASFTVSPDAEITIEANPGTIDKEKVAVLADAGVNRFSLGVQSFIDRELQLLGRVHNSDDAVRAIEIMRYSGVRNLSLDLIYGIPGQTMREWSYTLSKTLELSPEHISAYELTPEEGTPLSDSIKDGSLQKPDEDVILRMYYHAIDALTASGYKHYEISNFARQGFECTHNLNYWDRGQYIGLGAGAHSFIGDKRIKNTSDINRYINELKTGKLSIEDETEISCEDAIKEFIFLGIRKTGGLNVKGFRDDLGIDLLDVSDKLINDGLLMSDGNYLRLTRKGIVVSNTVIIQMFEALEL
jgi:oxygen-independent coproporphyrinogen-3 oxidase